jgi:hypothetical protein
MSSNNWSAVNATASRIERHACNAACPILEAEQGSVTACSYLRIINTNIQQPDGIMLILQTGASPLPLYCQETGSVNACMVIPSSYWSLLQVLSSDWLDDGVMSIHRLTQKTG